MALRHLSESCAFEACTYELLKVLPAVKPLFSFGRTPINHHELNLQRCCVVTQEDILHGSSVTSLERGGM